jgi:hypothetical protein
MEDRTEMPHDADDRKAFEDLVLAVLGVGKLFPKDLIDVCRTYVRNGDGPLRARMVRFVRLPAHECEKCKSSLLTDEHVDEVMQEVIRDMMDRKVLIISSSRKLTLKARSQEDEKEE